MQANNVILTTRAIYMNIKRWVKSRQSQGFTMIEVMIVLAIAGLIIVILFIAIPEAQVSVRDNHRKAYARSVYEALEEFYKNSHKFPGCVNGCDTSDMQKFMTTYMPDGRDPSTGLSYRSAPLSVVNDNAYGTGSVVKSANESSVYIDNGVHHYLMPKVGQIYIATAHWCYATAPDSGNGPPLAASGLDNDVSKFVIVIYQERGDYFCLDNYVNNQ
jgi:prepilin-type N-terminal cleavage/methylation domain-containing protein